MASEKGQALAQGYEANTWLIGRLTEGVSHEESLLQLPFDANCLNWVVGHIVHGRNTALTVLGEPALWPEEVAARYRTGSRPITGLGAARELAALLVDLQATHERLVDALGAMDDEALAETAVTDRGEKPRAEHVSGLQWHETYHIGQLELLQALAISQRDQ